MEMEVDDKSPASLENEVDETTSSSETGKSIHSRHSFMNSIENNVESPSTSSNNVESNSLESRVEEGAREVYVWGNHVNGELGVGGIEDEHLDAPTKLNFPYRISSISCGESHTGFILEDGTLWTCGSNDHGQLGHNKGRTRPGQVEGLGGRTIVQVSTGYAHTLAIDKWGTSYAWGSDSHGQLGLGESGAESKVVPFPKMIKALALKNVVQVAAGHFHSLLLTNSGELYTCGSNSHGQLGLSIGNSASQSKPLLVELLIGLPLSLISAGGFHSFALSSSSSVFAWGKNNLGQLGVSDTEDRVKPTQLTTLKSLAVKYIDAGLDHSAFLTADGGVFTCGNGTYGQLGHSSFSSEMLPRKILEFGSVIVQVVCGRSHTLCLSQNNKMYSFGLGASGQLGLGLNGGNKNSPMPILPLSTSSISFIASGGDQSFVLTSPPNTLKSPSDFRTHAPSTQILRLSSELIEGMSRADEPVDLDLMSLVEGAFASPAAWNASFLKENDEHIPSTWKNKGIDLEMASRAFKKLENIKSSGLNDLIELLVFKELLPKLPHQLKHTEILRVYVLLPLLPTFYRGSNHMIPVFYGERVQSLMPPLLSVVIHWIFDLSQTELERLINVYKRVILLILDSPQSKTQKDSVIRSCLTFLSTLHKHNRHCLKLPYNAFSIPQISEKVNIVDDYLQWFQPQDKNSRFRPLFYCDYPFVFDAQAKTILLQFEQRLKMENAMRQANTSMFPFPFFQPDPTENQFLNLKVARVNIVQDTLDSLVKLTTNDLKKPLRVKFVGEEGEDAGGVKKEFFLLLIREILNPKFGMFQHYEESHLIWFSVKVFEDQIMYFLIGLICGLAIYNFTIINLPFPLALYKKLLDEKVDLNDFKELNPTVGRSLQSLLSYDSDDFEEVFDLSFEISQEAFGATEVVPLKPGGSSIGVTRENRAEFVDLYVHYVLNSSVSSHFNAFKSGFDKVCGNNILPLFHAQELQAMVTGNEDYDWNELEKCCEYKGGYSATDSTIILFWKAFHSLTLQEKKQFLLFVTGSDRIPILGMKALKICIQPVGTEKHFPVAHTCFNLLDLPRYQTLERLKYKLLQSIQHHHGFSIA